MAKGGKYSRVIDGLPRLPGVEPDRREIVERVQQEILDPPGGNDPLGDAAHYLEEADEAVTKALRILKRSTAGKRYAAEFGRAYADLRSAKNRIDSWWKDVNLLIEAYQWLMVEQMEVEGVSSLKLTNGQPITTYLEPYATVVDKEKFRQWCIKQGLETQMQLPWQTTNNLTKQMLLAGEAEPDGVTCWAKTKVRLGTE